MTTADPPGPNAFIKQLAANDKRKRDAALDKLRSYISHRQNFDKLELLKLWKGLFYCMWMSDKPRPQQQLARDLAGLVDAVREPVVLDFLDAFWETMSREWTGIDVLRMDKFLYLIRCYLHASFQHFARRGWRDTTRLEEYMAVLATTPLNPTDPKVPNGLRMHTVDVYVDELDKVDKKREGKMPVQTLLEPVRMLAKESPTKSIRKHVLEALEDERLRDWNGANEHDADPLKAQEKDDAMEEDEWGGIDD